MKSFSDTTLINAPAERVWSILTDAAAYPEWDPTMIRLEGDIARGEQLTIYSTLAPKRAFKPTVAVFEAPHKMVWASGMPLGLFKGERTFLLEAAGEDRTRMTLTEEFSGLLLPLFGGSIPDMNPVFEEFNAALKARAEQA